MPHGKICYIEIPAGAVSGTWVAERDRTPGEQTRAYIMVDDIVATLQQIEVAGGRVIMGRTDIGRGGGAFAIFTDPAGTEFGLYEEPRP